MIINCKQCKKEIYSQLDRGTVIVCDSCNTANLIQTTRQKDNKTLASFTEKFEHTFSITIDNITYQIIGAVSGIFNETRLAYFFTKDAAKTENLFIYYDDKWYHAQKDKLRLLPKRTILEKKVSHVTKFDDLGQLICVSKSTFTNRSYFGETALLDTDETSTYQEWLNDKAHYLIVSDDLNFTEAYVLKPVTLIAEQLPTNFLLSEQKYNCKYCNEEIVNHIYPISQSFICVKCGQAHSIVNDHLLKQLQYDNILSADIPLGTILNFTWGSYTVIGYLNKRDHYGYNWSEYSLWSEKNGIAFISVYNGHFQFLTKNKKAQIFRLDTALKKEVTFENKEDYDLFNNYTAYITSGRGLFFGNITNDGTVANVEYIAPPYLRNVEHVGHESIDFYDGTYLTHKEIYNAAGDQTIFLNTKIGIGATQFAGPSTWYLLLTVFMMLFVLVLSFAVTNINKENKSIFNYAIPTNDSIYNRSGYTIPDIQLKNNYNSIKINFSTNLSNRWLEVNTELINIETGKTYVYEKGVEYYSGYEDGYNWSEGSQNGSFTIDHLPKGKYQINLTHSTDDSMLDNYKYEVIVNPTLFRNLWLPFVILFVLALIYALYVYWVERERWKESPYNPMLS